MHYNAGLSEASPWLPKAMPVPLDEFLRGKKNVERIDGPSFSVNKESLPNEQNDCSAETSCLVLVSVIIYPGSAGPTLRCTYRCFVGFHRLFLGVLLVAFGPRYARTHNQIKAPCFPEVRYIKSQRLKRITNKRSSPGLEIEKRNDGLGDKDRSEGTRCAIPATSATRLHRHRSISWRGRRRRWRSLILP